MISDAPVISKMNPRGVRTTVMQQRLSGGEERREEGAVNVKIVSYVICSAHFGSSTLHLFYYIKNLF